MGVGVVALEERLKEQEKKPVEQTKGWGVRKRGWGVWTACQRRRWGGVGWGDFAYRRRLKAKNEEEGEERHAMSGEMHGREGQEGRSDRLAPILEELKTEHADIRDMRAQDGREELN
eukprot:766137-Hanusia_phi.AAC.1